MEISSLFVTVVEQENLQEAALMINSLRTFGGELRNTPFWVFSTESDKLESLMDGYTLVWPLSLPVPGPGYLFEKKVTACAKAETLIPPGIDNLAWVDPGFLFTAPPTELLLEKRYQAAFRPVHIRNVGMPVGEPLDAFWKGICQAVGVEDVPGTVTSFVDGQLLRTYYNSHAFSFRTGLGLMQEWLELFLELTQDTLFQSEACQDESHRVFLFQALLSALVAARVGSWHVKLLPPTYNYPYNLQDRIPAEKRVETLNEPVCFAYEDQPVHPSKLQGIGVNEPLKGWLEANAPR